MFAQLGQHFGVVAGTFQEVDDVLGESSRIEAARDGRKSNAPQRAATAIALHQRDDELLVGGELEGCLQFKACPVIFAKLRIDGPGRVRIAINGTRWIEVILSKVSGRSGELEDLPIVVIGIGETGAGLKSIQHKVRAVRRAASRSFARKLRVSQRFKLEARDAFQCRSLENDTVGIGIRSFA